MTYLKKVSVSFLLAISFIGIFNWFVDPYGMHWSPKIERVNLIKTEAGNRSRVSKVYQVDKIKPSTLIVGNSRAEMGINPQHPLLKNGGAYNQAIPGAGIEMQVDYAINALEANPSINKILMSVDFLDFLIDSDKKPNLTPNLPNYAFRLQQFDKLIEHSGFKRAKELSGFIFSLDAFESSLTTLARQSSNVSSINEYGFNSGNTYVEIMKTEGLKPLFQQKLNEVSLRLKKSLVVKIKEVPPYSPKFSKLSELIEYIQSKGIQLILFINPYHYSYLHLIHDNEQFDNFLLWKELLVNFLALKTNQNYTIWDFSNINAIINEKVPLDTPKTHMKWFWEPAHYKEELGDKMLSVMLLNKHGRYPLGKNINTSNIRNINNQDKSNLTTTTSQWQHLIEDLKLISSKS